MSLKGPKPRRKYSADAFYISIALVLFIATISTLKLHLDPRDDTIIFTKRHQPSEPRNLECRLIHHAEDKCNFVKENCSDEEAGLFSYLTVYYCKWPHTQPVAFFTFVLWLGLLFSTIGIAASDFFCVNLSTISSLLGMSETMAGVTFLAFGNGSPDVFSTFAAMSTHSGSLAVGELLGAAGFITAVVAGSMALVRPFKVVKKTFVRDVGFFIVASSFSIYFLLDGRLQLWECATMVGFYIFYVIVVVSWHWWSRLLLEDIT
jgi:solute carrier family 24 (sodium/potassium/calcium exchanger), member 6